MQVIQFIEGLGGVAVTNQAVQMCEEGFVTMPQINSMSAQWFDREAAACKAFAHPTRIHLLTLLCTGSRPLATVQERLAVSKANLSQHVAILKSAGLVTSFRRQNRLYCALAFPEIRDACNLAHKLVRAQVRRERRLVL